MVKRAPSKAVTAHFEKLVFAWKALINVSSMIEDQVLTAPYQQLIGMGPAILPLIFTRLENHDEYWFWALVSITGEDPAAETESFEEAKQAWLAWAHVHGYLGPL
jgi:hypothetical protein